MPLLLPYDASGLDGKLRTVIDDILGRIQIWAGKQEGINAAERINELSTGIASLSVFSSGDIIATGRSTARTGFLMCDGAAVSRTTYGNLFAAIGSAYGAGDGVSTFNVPNLQQRFPLGKAASGTGSTLGSTGGAIDHTHTLSGSTANESSHTHGAGSYATETHNHGGATGVGSDETEICSNCGPGSSVFDTQVFDHTHSISTQAALDVTGTSGSGSAHNHGAGTLATGTANPPYQVVNYMIKT